MQITEKYAICVTVLVTLLVKCLLAYHIDQSGGGLGNMLRPLAVGSPGGVCVLTITIETSHTITSSRDPNPKSSTQSSKP
jgi:hypothetical protein